MFVAVDIREVILNGVLRVAPFDTSSSSSSYHGDHGDHGYAMAMAMAMAMAKTMTSSAFRFGHLIDDLMVSGFENPLVYKI